MRTAAKYKLVLSKSLTYLILVNDLMYRTLPCKPIKLNYQAHMYNADADCQWIKNRNTANAKFLDTQIYSIHFANIFLFLLCTVYGIHRLFCYILGKQKKDILLINAYNLIKVNHSPILFSKVCLWVDRTC